MSAGAVFKLIANDGKADRMIMATALLNQRIKDVMCARASSGKEDPTPTLVDLEKTHILYVNAHFKPFAAIGFEYNKVRPASGTPTLGSTVQFSIPQFGDFFYDMVLRTRLSQFQGVPTSFTAPVGGAYYYDAYGRGWTSSNTATTPTAFAQGATVNYYNLVRYCEYPGNRLISSVKFDVNGNPLDQYSSYVTIMLEKFTTPVGKREGYNRLVGQQVPRECYGAPVAAVVNDANATTPGSRSGGTPSGISLAVSGQSNRTVGLYDVTLYSAAAANITAFTTVNTTAAVTPISTLNANVVSVAAQYTNANYQFDGAQPMSYITNGPQTPKLVQPPLELWHKLKFWFCDDVRLAIPSVSIPFGQRFITVSLAAQKELAFEFPNIYYTGTDVLGAYDTYNTNAANAHANNYSQPQSLISFGGTTPITVEAIELYINNIFVNPEIHDIYIKRIGFSLIRVYREQYSVMTQSAAGNMLLSQLKWPIEYMYVGLQPLWNTATPSNAAAVGNNLQQLSSGSVNWNTWRDWHRMTRQVDVSLNGSIGGMSAPANVQATQTTAGVYGTNTPVTAMSPDFYWLPVSTVDSLQLQAHGITIYDSFQDIFFSEYLPYNYGGAALNTPSDTGAFFINFALFPRSYQPSGHLNISRARETYLYWTTSYISTSTSAALIVAAVAINFLLISDGSAVLRYST